MRSKIFVVFILSIVKVQPFLNDFRSAMHHIEYGFENLLSNVVTDMEYTLDCTRSAIEHILIINNMLNKSSDFDKKCINICNVKNTKHRRQIESGNLDAVYNTGDDNSKHIVPQDLHNSIASVNRTLQNIRLIKDRDDTTDDFMEPLRDEKRKLSEVTALFQRELEKISSNVKSELENINCGNSPECLIMDEIKILHKVKNESNASDIDHLVGSALTILKSNNNSSFEISNKNIEKVINELENVDSDVESKSVQSKDNNATSIDDDFLQSSLQNKNIFENKILNANNFNRKPSNYMPLIFSFFNNISDEKRAEEEAMNIINESTFASSLFDDENVGHNLFENADLFNF